jgi:hypothetical protein
MSTTTKSTVVIPPFAGSKPDFPRWKQQVIGIGLKIDIDNTGFIPFQLVTPEEYAEIQVVPQPCVVHAKPDEISGDASKDAKAKNQKMVLAYKRQQTEQSNFQMALVEALGDTVRSYLISGGKSEYHLTLLNFLPLVDIERFHAFQ